MNIIYMFTSAFMNLIIIHWVIMLLYLAHVLVSKEITFFEKCAYK